MIEHKGYTAPVVCRDGLYYGEVLGIRDVVTFEGPTEGAAEAAFRESVDDYLAMCAAQGRAPAVPAPSGPAPDGCSVRACRGHWHVTTDMDDLAIPGDPFPDEASALAALERMRAEDAGARDEVSDLQHAAAVSFFATEASALACPTCGHAINATDSLAVPAATEGSGHAITEEMIDAGVAAYRRGASTRDALWMDQTPTRRLAQRSRIRSVLEAALGTP